MHSKPSAPRLLQKVVLSTAALLLSAAFAPSAAMATTVSMGYNHGCSVADTGGIQCWGLQALQEPSGGLADHVKVGHDFSCALFLGPAVRCWGSNGFSQLGAQVKTRFGVTISGLPQPAGVVAGARHACALTAEREVYCWGDGSLGQIGKGVSTTTAQAIRVEGLGNIKSVAAGNASTCGTTDSPNDRKVTCVGAGSGLAGAAEYPSTPRTVPGITDALDVSLFAGHACVLRGFGKVSCWGSNRYGELGVPASSSPLTSPVEVPDLGAPAKAVAVGDGFTCALLEGGTVKCWGNHANGQLGMGLAPITATPATGLVIGITDATAISAGKTAACAVLDSGYVQCWGEGAGWSSAQCRVPGGLYPGVPASWGPIFDLTICRPQGSAAPMAVKGPGPALDAAHVMDWAEKTLPQTFPSQMPTVPESTDNYFYLRDYPGGHRLATNRHGTPHLLYMGPLSAGQLSDLGPLSRWLQQAAIDEGAKGGLQMQVDLILDGHPSNRPCKSLKIRYGIRGGLHRLPEWMMATSIRVADADQSTDFPARGGFHATVLTTETDWLSRQTRQPGEPVPLGMKEEPVFYSEALVCSIVQTLQTDVEVTVFYIQADRKGAVRARTQMRPYQ